MPCPEIPWFKESPKRRRYLAGISGGADSVALLHLLHRHGFRDIVVCHLDHRLRGRASTGDARFVGMLADRLGYRMESAREDIGKRSRETGTSLETAARVARHAFFADCARRYRCKRLLLAHHLDDQAETILWNLLRGSRGLAGMEAEREIMMAGKRITCIRPLLGSRRLELRSWLTEEQLIWREDATNGTAFAARNRLRNEALPLLSEIARRDAAFSIVRAARAESDRRDIERWAVEQAAAADPLGRLHLPKLRSLPPALRAACLYDFLRTSGVGDLSRTVLDRCLGLVDPAVPPSVNLPGGRVLRRRGGRLLIDP